MKINLQEELKQDKEKLVNEINVLKEVKLLLEGEEAEDKRILRNLSPHSKINKVEAELGAKMDIERLDQRYAGNVYTLEQIKKLAINYNLRFLPAKYYTGAFDVEVAAKIKAFGKETGAPIDNASLELNYIILAPPSQFQLKKEKHIYKREIRAADPMLFFRISETKYRLIHKWGSDFSVVRLLSGFRWRGFWSHWLFNTVMVLPVFVTLLALIFGAGFHYNYNIIFWLSAIIGSALFAHIRWGWGKLDDMEIVRGFFTPDNFNSTNKITQY